MRFHVPTRAVVVGVELAGDNLSRCNGGDDEPPLRTISVMAEFRPPGECDSGVEVW